MIMDLYAGLLRGISVSGPIEVGIAQRVMVMKDPALLMPVGG